jgi:ornithine cyclodeaminase/alanine dehydrogenase-like protein (mu-crystallin family)
MSGPVWLDAGALRRALPMAAAIDALEQALRADDIPRAPLRTGLPADGGELLMMPATGAAGTGVKLVAVQPANPARGLPFIQGVYALFAPDTLTPAAVIDGGELTRLRTAAVSGLATRLLARPDARRLVVFGAGIQAAAHVEAMRAVRPISHVTVVTRGRARGDELVSALAGSGVAAEPGEPADVARADIVCCCTNSPEPVCDGGLLAPGCHVNAVGSYQPHTREIDSAAVERSQVTVDDREAVLAEAGDLLIPISEGRFAADRIRADLRELARGAQVRAGDDDITLFKCVGVAFEDLAVAAAARRAADG